MHVLMREVERLRLLDHFFSRHAIGNGIEDAALRGPRRAETSAGAPSRIAEGTRSEQSGSELLDALIQSLQEFQLERIETELNLARNETSTREFIFSVVGPLLSRVGEEVMKDRLTIAQEHALSAILRDQLGYVFRNLKPYQEASEVPLPSGKRSGAFHNRVILAAFEGDLHEFGILMGAILCSLNRYRTHYLGVNLPVQDLARAVDHLQVGLIILGIAPLPEGFRKRSWVEDLVALDTLLPKGVQVWVGGGGWNTVELENALPHWRERYHRLLSLKELDQLLSKKRQGVAEGE